MRAIIFPRVICSILRYTKRKSTLTVRFKKMKKDTKTAFSLFLNKVYLYKKEDISLTTVTFVEGMMNAVGTEFDVSYELKKSLFNGLKPLSDKIRKELPKRPRVAKTRDYLLSVLNKKRVRELMNEFKIDKDEKEDMKILCESLAIQFINIIVHKDGEIPTEVRYIYPIVLDENGNGRIKDANEIALHHALNYFRQAVEALGSIKPNSDLITLQRPFENFFDSIYKAFRVYNEKCNREGRDIIKSCKKHFLGNGECPEADKYLEKITEPGASPIELEKRLIYIIYDNYAFKDQVMQVSIKLNDKSERSKVIEQFKKLKFYPVNEICFTEMICFNEKGKKENLIDHVTNICYRTDLILNSIRLNIKKDHPLLTSLDEEFQKAFNKFADSKMQYLTDGTYYPETGEVIYAPTINPYFVMGDGKKFQTSDNLKDMSTLFMGKKVTGKEFTIDEFPYFFSYNTLFRTFMWEMCGYKDLMGELYLFTRDNKYRLFAVPVTCKARIYRLSREARIFVLKDDVVGFMYSSIMSTLKYKTTEDYKKILQGTTSDERIAMGEDTLINFGYYKGKLYSESISLSDAKAKKQPTKESSTLHMFVPLTKEIVINELIHDKKEKKNK